MLMRRRIWWQILTAAPPSCCCAPQANGPRFEPIELGAEVGMQMYTKDWKAHYEPVWLELNGHALLLYQRKQVSPAACSFASLQLLCPARRRRRLPPFRPWQWARHRAPCIGG